MYCKVYDTAYFLVYLTVYNLAYNHMLCNTLSFSLHNTESEQPIDPFEILNISHKMQNTKQYRGCCVFFHFLAE